MTNRAYKTAVYFLPICEKFDYQRLWHVACIPVIYEQIWKQLVWV